MICSPQTTILLSKGHMMAPDGRCKAFDARADGFVRGEGCGIVVLKRLSDAIADGDRVLGVIRGSAINQDGRSSGITAPNGPSQEAVIRAALAAAGVGPAEVSYVEAHGTGTSLGDPIEVRALGGVFAASRAQGRPLAIGSVKTNIGHLESSAGVAGLMKVILALQHRWLPPHLHLGSLNPHIEWAGLPIVVPSGGQPWPEGFNRRLAGVSSFGFSGTNAHIVVEEAPAAEEPQTETDRPRHVLTLSAKTDRALGETVERFIASLDGIGSISLGDVCHSANAGRSQMPRRLAATADTIDELRERLAAYKQGQAREHVFSSADKDHGPPEIVFLFSGQGAQYQGMARELYDSQSVFRLAFDRCAAAVDGEIGVPLREIVFGSQGDLLDQTAFTQPALFAVEYALATMWRRWGIEPALVIGHSLGEFAAAVVAGVLSVEDAARLVVARGRLMQSVPPGGAMAAAFTDEQNVLRHIQALPRLGIAAVNAPDTVVVSGDAGDLDQLRQQFAGEGIETRLLRISNGFHSPLVDPILAEMERIAGTVQYVSPAVPLISNLTGRELRSGEMNAAYWRRHLREPVRFADAMAGLPERDYVFLEVGPGTSLLGLARQPKASSQVLWLPSIRRGRSEWADCLDSLAALFAAGVRVDWAAFDEDHHRRRVALPTYPFEHVPHWVAEGPSAVRRPATGKADTTLPGARLATAVPMFECQLDPESPGALTVHRVNGVALVAAPFFIEAARAAIAAVTGTRPVVVSEVELLAPLRADRGAVSLQSCVHSQPEATVVEIFAAPASATEPEWVLHARVQSPRVALAIERSAFDSDAVIARSLADLTGEEYRLQLGKLGIDCDRGTSPIEHIWHRSGEALARLRLEPDLSARDWSPEILDAITVATAAAGLSDQPALRVLSRITNFRILGKPSSTLWVHVVLEGPASDLRARIRVQDQEGVEVLDIEALHLAPAPAFERDADLASLFYDIVWREAALPGQQAGATGAIDETPEREFARLAADQGLARYAALMPPFEALATDYARAALATFGISSGVGRPAAERIENARSLVAERHRRLFDRLVSWIPSSGDASADLLESSRLAERQQDLEQKFPEFGAELELLGRCAPRLAEAVRGEVDPLDLLFGDPAILTRLYEQSPFARTFNAFVAGVLAEVQKNTPAAETFRVLEVGAGTGGTTTTVLPRLNRHRTEYVFTDLSQAFLARARMRYRDYPFVQYRQFDVEQDGPSQNLQPHSFHVILAANVLHAAADLRAALQHLRELLAPGGLLVLVEGTQPQRWVDLTFGLTEGWWRFTDRRDYPLIGAQEWEAELRDLGFTDVAIIPGSNGNTSVGQVVIRAQSEVVAPVHVGSTRQWILVSPESELAAAIAARAEQQGDIALRLDRSADIDLAALSTSARTVRVDTRVVLIADEAQPDDPVDAAGAQCASLCDVLRSVRDVNPQERPSVWVVTRGGQPVAEGEGARVDHAALWGLGQVAALEQPETWGGLIDLDPGAPAVVQADAIACEVLGDGVEDRVAYREGRRYVPRLVQRAPTAKRTFAPDCERSWLITGGLGALGLRVADWLVRSGARHLVLLGRTELAAVATGTDDKETGRRLEGVHRLRESGARVEIETADVSGSTSIARIMARFGTEWPRLEGIVHTAATFGSRRLLDLTTSQLTDALRAKAGGAWQLHRHAPRELRHLVLFSSTASLVGGIGQGDYAAANAMLDALSHARRHAGLQSLSINWGLWEEMRHTSEENRRHYAAIGLETITSDRALGAMRTAIESDRAQCAIASIDWTLLKNAYQVKRTRPFLEELGLKVIEAVQPLQADRLVDRMAALDERGRLQIAVERVQMHVANILEMAESTAVPPERGLFEMGMDSLMSVELKNRLEREMGQSLPSTLTFNYPSVRALAGFLVSSVAPPSAAGPPPGDPSLDQLSEDELASLLSDHLEKSSS